MKMPFMMCQKMVSREASLLVILSLVSLAIIIYGAAGVRGTDQYWYIADVARLVANEPLVTNNYFPGVMLRTSEIPEVNYIMHNSPMLHIVGFFSAPGNEYSVWIAVNTVFHYLIALCIYLCSQKFTNAKLASIVTALYLISPIAIWQTINPLLEMYFGALVALLLSCFYFRASNTAVNFLLGGLLLLGVVSHPIFIVPSILWFVVSFYEGVRHKHKLIGIQSVLFLALLVFFMLNKDVWFPSSFQPDLMSIIASVVPGQSNMFWHYADRLPEVNADLFVSKFEAGFKKQFFEPKFVFFYMFTNLAIVIAFYLSLFRLRQYSLVLVPLILFGGQYIGMIVLQQNHPRFQQIIALVSFLLIALMLSESTFFKRYQHNFTKYYLPAFCVVLVLLNLFIAHRTREESLFEAKHMALLEEKINQVIPFDANVAGLDIKPHNPFSYAVRPRNMLFIRTDMVSDVSVNKALHSFEPDYLIVKKQSSFVVGVEVEKWKSELFGELYFYKN